MTFHHDIEILLNNFNNNENYDSYFYSYDPNEQYINDDIFSFQYQNDFTNYRTIEFNQKSIFKKNLFQDNFSNFLLKKKNNSNIVFKTSKPNHSYDYSVKKALIIYKNYEIKILNNLLKSKNIKGKFKFFIKKVDKKSLRDFFEKKLLDVIINNNHNDINIKRNKRLYKKLLKLCPEKIDFLNQPVSKRLRNFIISQEFQIIVNDLNKSKYTKKNPIDLTRICIEENLVDYILKPNE
jgi:DNA-binding SARP family transcriptional activator